MARRGGWAIVDRGRLAVGVLLTTLFVYLVVRYAWVAEDAYITLRTVDNFVHGFGLRWNVAERVQGYTHPLWMLLVSAVYAVTREDFLTLIFTCVTLSVAAFALLQRLAASTMQALCCGAILLLSPAYVDFSTSGLENALSHLLFVAFALVYLEAREEPTSLRRLSFVAALSMTNRLDLGLLLLPALALAAARAPGGWRARAGQIAVGLSPLVAWELFSLVYYGFLFPNTAYAKLDTGVSGRELLRHGLGYFASHATADPLTLTGIVVGVALGLSDRDAKLRALAVGVVLYLLYLVRIGGDFMLGRFLTPPLLVATIVIARCQLVRAHLALAVPLTAVFVAVGLWAPRAPVRAPLQPKPPLDAHGLADERLIYADCSSLAARRAGTPMPSHYWAAEGRALRSDGRSAVLAKRSVGYLGYFAGPRVFIIDENALTDPLLARLPVADRNWRIGHFTRVIPDGYYETVLQGSNQIRDGRVARLFDQVALVTRGPLFGCRRMVAIVRLNVTQPRAR
jgi:arabinofuranosyltransferase